VRLGPAPTSYAEGLYWISIYVHGKRIDAPSWTPGTAVDYSVPVQQSPGKSTLIRANAYLPIKRIQSNDRHEFDFPDFCQKITYPPINVDSQNQWQDTGIDIEIGELVTIVGTQNGDGWTYQSGQSKCPPTGYRSEDETAEWFWSNIGATAVMPSAPAMAMIAKLGAAMYRHNAAQFPSCVISFTAASAGRLYLSANDLPGQYSDNAGSATAVVTVTPE